MKKVGRNDPCPCGSGKKFKKCCESSMLGGRFKAAKIEDTTLSLPKKMTQLTGLFRAKVADIPQMPEQKEPKHPSPAAENPPSQEDKPENPQKEIES